MIFPRKNQMGFTLTELLVVIAIIGILSALVLTSSKPRDKGRVADAVNTMNQIRLALDEYYTDHGTYPPTYGYLDKVAFTELDADVRLNELPFNQSNYLNDPDIYPSARFDDNSHRYYVSRHYMHFLRNFGATDLYDRFALDDNDTDFDRYISRLEYVPTDGKDVSKNRYSSVVVSGGRPFLYFPVNMRQFKKVGREWIRNWIENPNRGPDGPRPDDGVGINRTLQNMHFPPPQYDAYVLMSIGPDMNTHGLVYDLLNDTPLRANNYGVNYHYHVAAMASFFMATRDLNVIDTTTGYVEGDDSLDFGYFERKARGQDNFEANYYPVTNTPGVSAPIIKIGGNYTSDYAKGLLGKTLAQMREFEANAGRT